MPLMVANSNDDPRVYSCMRDCSKGRDLSSLIAKLRESLSPISIRDRWDESESQPVKPLTDVRNFTGIKESQMRDAVPCGNCRQSTFSCSKNE